MFYIGAWFAENYEKALFSVIKQSLKNVKKHYHLIDLQSFKAGTDYSQIENELISLFNNRAYISNRRVFSQNRRPAKTVKTPPVIVMSFWDRNTSKIDRLREKNIPAEGISIRKIQAGNTQKWKKQEHSTICLGHNYYVDEPDIIKAFQIVTAQKRITMSDRLQDKADILDLLNNEDKLEGFSDVISAISLPIWFKETVRVVRRY